MPRQTLSPPRADEAASTGFPETITAYQTAQLALINREESGFAQDRAPRAGDAQRAQRGEGKHDGQATAPTHGIGALYKHHLLTLTLWDGYINRDVLYAWPVHELIPKLPTQALIVMHNPAFLRTPRRRCVSQAIPLTIDPLTPLRLIPLTTQALRLQQPGE